MLSLQALAGGGNGPCQQHGQVRAAFGALGFEFSLGVQQRVLTAFAVSLQLSRGLKPGRMKLHCCAACGNLHPRSSYSLTVVPESTEIKTMPKVRSPTP